VTFHFAKLNECHPERSEGPTFLSFVRPQTQLSLKQKDSVILNGVPGVKYGFPSRFLR
jgi:hypothetical protein